MQMKTESKEFLPREGWGGGIYPYKHFEVHYGTVYLYVDAKVMHLLALLYLVSRCIDSNLVGWFTT